jgi:hypothetical protein
MSSWLANRKRMRLDIAKAFSARSGISARDFLKEFYDSTPAPLIGDFDAEYVPDEAALGEMLSAVSEATGLKLSLVRSYFSRTETFAQFGEHLLRAGAYSKEKK